MIFKLANIIFRVDKHATMHPELYYRVLSGDASYMVTIFIHSISMVTSTF